MNAVKLGLLPVAVGLLILFAYTVHYEIIAGQCGECHAPAGVGYLKLDGKGVSYNVRF